jgi:SAM-dependent methyltransferase
VPLARDGHHVVAIDHSAPMLARLRDRLARAPAAVRARVAPAIGDLRGFDAGRRFPLAIAAFNVVEHLYTRVELAACLAAVRRHLEPGGAFAFDVQMPDLAWLLRDPSKRWARTRFTHPRTGDRLLYSTNHDYDPVSQIAMIRIYYDRLVPEVGTDEAGARRSSALAGDRTDPGDVVVLSQRKFFPAELEALVAAAGFAVVERYGDFAWQPLSGGAESQVLVCEPIPARSSRKSRR